MTTLLPGTHVAARGLRWEVVFSQAAGEQQLYRLRCLEGSLRGDEFDLLLPFEKIVALAPECNRSIVDASIQWFQHLRETGTFHQLIAVSCSVDSARQVRSLFAERGLQARETHSNMLWRMTTWAFR